MQRSEVRTIVREEIQRKETQDLLFKLMFREDYVTRDRHDKDIDKLDSKISNLSMNINNIVSSLVSTSLRDDSILRNTLESIASEKKREFSAYCESSIGKNKTDLQSMTQAHFNRVKNEIENHSTTKTQIESISSNLDNKYARDIHNIKMKYSKDIETLKTQNGFLTVFSLSAVIISIYTLMKP